MARASPKRENFENSSYINENSGNVQWYLSFVVARFLSKHRQRTASPLNRTKPQIAQIREKSRHWKVCLYEFPPRFIKQHLQSATTFSIREETIWDVRLRRLEERLLTGPDGWTNFTIWNAGKQGRRFYRSLSDAARSKVWTKLPIILALFFLSIFFFCLRKPATSL